MHVGLHPACRVAHVIEAQTDLAFPRVAGMGLH